MRGAVGLKSRDMRTPSLLGVALLCLFAMPAATDDDHQHPSNSCDGQYKDWTQIGQVCAKYFSTPSSFADAESACRQAASGGHLVSVHDEQTNAAVLAIVLKYNPSSPRTWLGGERVGQVMERRETWEEGRDVHVPCNVTSSTFTWTDGSSWDFEKWVPGQPSNSGNHENCVEMNWKNLGQWNDDWCIKQKPFICAFQWQHQRLD